MLPIVIGTRTRELALGVVAIDCVACGRRAIADVYRVDGITTLYSVELGSSWKSLQSFVTCRCCRSRQSLLPHLRASLNPGFTLDEPGSALIVDCLAVLPPTPPPPPPLARTLPPGVSRQDWAMLTAMVGARRRAFGRATVASASTVLGAVVVFCWLVVMYGTWNGDHVGPTSGELVGFFCFLGGMIGASWFWLQDVRSVLRAEFAEPLRRHLARTHTTPQAFVYAADQLGFACFYLRPFLNWVEAAVRRA